MKKQIIIGFLTGIIANATGVGMCVVIISFLKGTSVSEVFDFYLNSGNAWAVLTLGALPNLVLFFGFLKFDRDYRARGVVMATFITAITAYVLYFN
ncbi:hypothetical protein N9P25_02790 [Flavobacteriaceae bacterium]|jgi:hypothetical protein|nr:hypothetical protein [Flavobacteriaceae bacterium]